VRGEIDATVLRYGPPKAHLDALHTLGSELDVGHVDGPNAIQAIEADVLAVQTIRQSIQRFESELLAHPMNHEDRATRQALN